MDPSCRIELFGPLRVTQAGRTLTHFPRRKAAALLAFLALRLEQPQPRERLIDLFWPEMDLPAGRDSLSTVLGALRRMLEPAGVPRGSILIATNPHVGLNPAAVTTDAAEFERLLGQAERAGTSGARAALLTKAAALSQGEFLPGLYDDWAVREAERLQARHMEALRQWSEALEQSGDAAGALQAARQRLAADPFAEDAHLRVVALHVRAGRPAAARDASQGMERLWRDEFGEPPTSQSRQAAAALLASPACEPDTALPPPADLAAGLRPGGGFGQNAPLPAVLDHFFGREAEMERLAQALAPSKESGGPPDLGEAPDPGGTPDRRAGPSRLVTLVGLGGTGKTRLALEFGHHVAARFGMRCCFVSLAETASACDILPAIANALLLPLGGSAPLEQIAAFFRALDRPDAPPPLLILDNLEHLLPERAGEADAAEVVRRLLDHIPALACLCTSRRLLRVRGERVIPLDPLPVPDADAPSSEESLTVLLGCPSVRLYADRAQAVRPDFALTPGNAESVIALCRFLEGSPLALELAASWVRALPPRRMWERLAREAGRNSLEARCGDVPAHQRSLRAALDWSWRLLPSGAQRLLGRLSVFRGGWSLEAAQTVCGQTDALGVLADLEDASLLRTSEMEDGAARWRVLETVRDYARECLVARCEQETFGRRHAAYFHALAQSADLTGPGQALACDRLEVEMDNLRAALDFCRTDEGSVELGLRLSAALLPFWRARGHLREGRERCLALLSLPGAALRTASRVAALNAVGMLTILLAEYLPAEALHQEARVISREIGDIAGEADALQGLGSLCFWNQDYRAADCLFEQSLGLRRQAGDECGEAVGYHSLGNVAMRTERHEEAQSFYERALEIRRRRGDTPGVAATLGGLGQVAFARSDYDRAARHVREALRLFDAAGQRWTAALCLSDLSRIAEAEKRTARAVRLSAAATALREKFHFAPPPAERAGQEERITTLRHQLGDAQFVTAWDEGSTLPWRDVVVYALLEVL